LPVFSFLIRLINKKTLQKGGKQKHMEEAPKAVCTCEECAKRELDEKRNNEIALAFLIALTPLMTLTLFGNMGLI
jgi:hypothetical protein